MYELSSNIFWLVNNMWFRLILILKGFFKWDYGMQPVWTEVKVELGRAIASKHMSWIILNWIPKQRSGGLSTNLCWWSKIV